jgi:hypothetical protein
MEELKTGQRITLSFEGREFDVIVIDPNGLGEDQPSVGFGYRMGEKYAGLPESTLRAWVRDSDDQKVVELPSGKVLRVRDILASDGNNYSVIEASDWFALAVDVLVNPGRTGKGLRAKLGDFIGWFAVKGFYAESYVSLKGVYTTRDSRATTKWLEARQLGKFQRKVYTDLLQSENADYGYWTDYIYQELFGMRAKEMKQEWELMDGKATIARNYIPKAEGLQAVAYCEDMVVRIFVDSLNEAHQTAVNLTKRKFLGGN